MKLIAICFTLLSISAFAQNTIDRPSDLRTDKILVYLNSLEETTELVNDEFETSNDRETKEKRKEALRQYEHSRYGKVEGDTYAVAVEVSIVNWINESIQKICTSSKGKTYIIVDRNTLDNYKVDDWRYILKSKYLFEKGDRPLDSKMVFFFHDRKENKDLLNTEEQKNSFHPFFYYTADKIYPFYGMIRTGRVKKEWEAFFKNL